MLSLHGADAYFYAEANHRNRPLLQPETTCAKASRYAANFFSLGIAYGLKQAAIKYYCKAISPAVQKKYDDFWSGEESGLLRTIFRPEHRSILTPDGAKIHAIIYRHKDSQKNTPTLLYCNGLGQLQEGMEINEYLKQNIDSPPCNFVTFNYRLVSSQDHLTSSKDFIIDCEAVLQCIEQELHTPQNEIHFHGRSLGGGVAVKTQALDSQLTGVNVNESSFASMRSVIGQVACRALAALNDALGFGMEVEADFRRLNARRKILLLHPEDNIVRFPVSLANAVRGNPDDRTQIIYLQIKDGFVPQDTIHNLSLDAFQDAHSGASPLKTISEAISEYQFF